MAKTANEELYDAMIRHQTYLLRYSSSVRNQINKVLGESEKDIASILARRLAVNPGLTRPVEWVRLENTLREITKVRGTAWSDATSYWTNESLEFAKVESHAIARMVADTAPVVIQATMPSPRMLRSIVLDRPFEGRVLKDWAATMQNDDIRRISNAIQLGMVAGEDAATITKRVIGSRALMGADGVTEVSRRQVNTIVRTGVQHIANSAREEFFSENEDVLEGEQFVSTLDSRTSPQCRALDGKTFPVGKGPVPPLHYGCRSLRVAWFGTEMLGSRPAKPATERMLVEEYAEKNGLQGVKSRDGLPRGTKGDYDKWAQKRVRELTGPVPASTNYQDWLRRQSTTFQNDVLGPTRAELFRNGNLTLDKFVDVNGNQYTLKQLSDLYGTPAPADREGMIPRRTAGTPHNFRSEQEVIALQRPMYYEALDFYKENPQAGTAVKAYQRTGIGNSGLVNDYLRADRSDDANMQRRLSQLDLAVKSNKLDPNLGLYRGTGQIGNLKLPTDINEAVKLIGEITTEKGYSSTAIAPSMFVSGDKSMVYIKGAKNGSFVFGARDSQLVKKALDTKVLSEGAEILLPRGLEFRITGVSRANHPWLKDKSILVYEVEII